MARECVSCDTAGRRGYCAKGRCYCDHETCQGFASWFPLPEPVLEAVPTKLAGKSRWDAREDSTWIDKL